MSSPTIFFRFLFENEEAEFRDLSTPLMKAPCRAVLACDLALVYYLQEALQCARKPPPLTLNKAMPTPAAGSTNCAPRLTEIAGSSGLS